MSLGGDPSDTLDDAVRRSIAAGVTYVVAAGNDSMDATGVSPARVSEAITVGATDPTDTKPWWSNFGPGLDIFAPGVTINAAWHTSDTATRSLSGTSMASPHAAGVVAIYLGQVGHKSPTDVRNAIVAAGTAGVVGSPGTGSPNLLLYSGFLMEGEGARVNVALAANGATAAASSSRSANYPPASVINGDRLGVKWAAGGGWTDATASIFPDWLEITFSGTKTIDEVAVFTIQDNSTSPSPPTPTMTFALYGLVDFIVQYWTGSTWDAVPGGVVRGNNLVWRRVTFPAITTSRIRVLAERAADGRLSRLVEIEAYEAAVAPGNAAPAVALTAPSDGAVFPAPADIVVSADASDSDGSVAEVAFFSDGAPIGTDSTAPYSITWTTATPGAHILTAVATDNLGAATTSTPVDITVGGGARVNVALATNGATATASSTRSPAYPPGSVINGDRLGVKWAAGGGWTDATAWIFPDWVEIAFSGMKTIDEVAVFTIQDNSTTPSPPTPTMTFALYGLVDFTVQYWTGSTWDAVPGGAVRGNNLVWRRVTFPAVTTSRIRILAERAADGRLSRLVEIEAFEAPASSAE
jgi:hypothetical protein